MLRVQVCAAHMGGFLGPKFSKQGSLYGRFSLSIGGLSRNWRKIVKNGWFSTNIHHKSGYSGKFQQLEEGTFLKTGWQTPIHPQIMYPGSNQAPNILNILLRGAPSFLVAQ